METPEATPETVKEEVKTPETVAAEAANAGSQDTNLAAEQAALAEGQPPVVNSEEEDDGIEWNQVRKPVSPHNSNEQSNELAEALSQLTAANQRIAELEAQVSLLSANPVSELWASYHQANGENATVEGFFKEFKAEEVISGIDEEQKMRIYYRDRAISLGIPEAEIEETVNEDYDKWFSGTRSERAEVLKQAEKHLTEKSKNKLLEVDQKWKKTVSDAQIETAKWATEQEKLLKEYVSKVVAKGKFNGRAVDSAWGERIMQKALESSALIDPDLVDRDEHGNIFAPDAIDFLDRSVYRKQLADVYKTKSQKNIASQIEARAAEAHNARIQNELVVEKSRMSKEDEELEKANIAAGRIKVPTT